MAAPGLVQVMSHNPPMDKVSKRRRHLMRQGLAYSVALVLGILLLEGLGFWWLDPSVSTLSDGLWLAFTTAATVGYGDMVPTTHSSRLFAVLVVVMGLAVLSLVTASLSAILVEKEVETEDRQIEADLMRELHALRLEVRALRESVHGRVVETAVAAAPTHAATVERADGR
jgi:voltage-gated potassium channel